MNCLEKSLVSVDEFWSFMSSVRLIRSIIEDLSKEPKDFFFLALSSFLFDFYLTPQTKYLMSRPASPLRELLLKQLQGKTLFATSTNNRFRREFCTDGLVLGSMGQILFVGKVSEAIEWADQNLESSDVSASDDEQFEMGLNLINSEILDDQEDDFA